MNKAELLALADRCEKAEGPDRELDALIFIGTHWPDYRIQTECHQFPDEVRPGRIQCNDGESGWRESPTYTASLDSAMTLLPDHEGVGWKMSDGAGGPTAEVWCFDFDEAREHYCVGANAGTVTPALALCSAALRARAEQSDA